MADLGLDKIEPARAGKASKFTDDEWRQIDAARDRGVSWEQIHDHTKRYPNKASLVNAATERRRRQKRAQSD